MFRHLTDDQVLFLIALGIILVVTGLATALERLIHWLRKRSERESDVIEIHAEKPNPL